MTIRKIEKRVLPSGLISYRAPFVDASGKRRSKNFATLSEAKSFLHDKAVELRKAPGAKAVISMTVTEAGDYWIAQCKRDEIDPLTIEDYERHLNLHIVPLIGELQLSELTTPEIKVFRSNLYDSGRSKDMVRRVTISLGALIREARSHGVIVNASTTEFSAKRGSAKRDKVPVVPPTKAELQMLIAQATKRGLRWRAFVLVAVWCGLRASELRGLAWQNIDTKKNRINIRQRADARGRIGPPKSASAIRSIKMVPLVVQALREWKLACPKGDLGLVFPNQTGGVETYDRIMWQGFEPIQSAARITTRQQVLDADNKPATDESGKPVFKVVPKYGLHALRHACASLWIEQGFNMKKIQVLMGHSSIQVTFDTYGHLFDDEEADDRAAIAVQKLLKV